MGGDPEHQEIAQTGADVQLERVATALGLLRFVIETVVDGLRAPGNQPGPNELGSAACFNRTFRDLRGAVLLVMSGYYGQARTVLRSAYEAAALGDLLAKDPALAEKWMLKQESVPHKEVRRYIEAQTLPDEQPSPYRAFYRELSAWAHPSARACVPYVAAADGQLGALFETEFDSQTFQTLMHEVAGQAVFACLSIRRAVVHEDVLPPEWRRALAALVRDAGQDGSDLERDWTAEQERFQRLREAVIPADQLDEYLKDHPNAWDNAQARLETDD